MAKTASRSNADRALLLRLLDEAFDKKAWHGTNLRGSLRRVTPEQALWRPKRSRKNIAEIVLHCAYWKYAVRRRIRGDKRGSFPLKGSNWFAVPVRMTDKAWRESVGVLVTEHVALREAIVDAPWSRLCEGSPAGANILAPQIHGVAMHDLYHAGQIQTLKALQKTSQ